MSLSKTKVDKISKDIIAALKEVEKKHNIKIEMNGGTFTDESMNMKLKIKTKNSSGKINHFSEFEENFNFWVEHLENVLPSDLHKPFKYNNESFVIVGYNRKARKYPFVIQSLKDFKNNNSTARKATKEFIMTGLNR